jgi:hypothetical protein
MSSFFVKSAVVGVLLCGATWAVEHYAEVNFIGPMAYGLLVYFFVFSIIAVFLSQNALVANNHRRFLNALTGSLVAKVLLTAFVVLVFALVDRPKSVLVILPLFVYYVVFTVLEVAEFMKLNRKAGLQQKVG